MFIYLAHLLNCIDLYPNYVSAAQLAARVVNKVEKIDKNFDKQRDQQ